MTIASIFSHPPMPLNKSDSNVSVWNYKPWWCQPWSIVLTGVAIVSASWFLLKLWWLTALVAVPILVWMGYFLLIYPRLMQDVLQQEDISSGSS